MATTIRINRRKVKHTNLESCFLLGYADADQGFDRVAPMGWNAAEKQAWLKGYDSFGSQEVQNAA
jgi:hypothetical protein